MTLKAVPSKLCLLSHTYNPWISLPLGLICSVSCCWLNLSPATFMKAFICYHHFPFDVCFKWAISDGLCELAKQEILEANCANISYMQKWKGKCYNKCCPSYLYSNVNFFLIKITSDYDNQLIFFLSMQLTSEILE